MGYLLSISIFVLNMYVLQEELQMLK